MKRFMVLVVGLAFMFSTVAFAADKAPKGEKKDKAAVSEKAPAATTDTMAADKPATDTKDKKADKKAKKTKKTKKEKKTEEAAPAAK